MIEYIFAALLGYLVGSLSPAALLSKIKQKDLRKIGTKNLGATNVTLTFGKGWGVLVVAIDMAKAVLPYKITELIFPETVYIGMIAGAAAVIGHVFPFYLGFKGGKGLATFGGLVLAYDLRLFFLMLVMALLLASIVNHGFVLPFFGGIIFPFAVAVIERDLLAIIIAFIVSALLIFKNSSNMIKAVRGEDKKISEYIKWRQ